VNAWGRSGRKVTQPLRQAQWLLCRVEVELACQRETTGGRESGLLGVELVANHGGHHWLHDLEVQSSAVNSLHINLFN
jgi:hypothetical protein